jgi:hypothetical protein
MSISSKDAWLVPKENQLALIPDSGEAWSADYKSAVFNYRGSGYRNPKYASEWLALTTNNNRQAPVGIYFDMVMFPELILWLNQGFENVQRVRGNAFRILLTSEQVLHEERWPFIPAEALQNEKGDFVIWIPCFFEYK